MSKEQNKANGAEKLIKKMTDRAYAEVFDLSETNVRDSDYVPEEDEIDFTKDDEIKGR